MRRSIFFILFLAFVLILAFKPSWGFFGHRTINEYATYTLPNELFTFYKPHIKFVREHAVDPDMRRYALKREAGRHYIDIDYWGKPPFDVLPRTWDKAFNKMLHVSYRNSSGDTVLIKETRTEGNSSMDSIFNEKIKRNFFAANWEYTCEDIQRAFPRIKDCAAAMVHDSLYDFGISPYAFMYIYDQLVDAFDKKDKDRILRYSTNIGHYVGDAHVPLHTTLNYNGALTNQDGIHGFWESRLPELFAEDNYDFVVGQAEYIEDMRGYIWDVILDSHSHLDSVLLIEKRLREEFPKDQQNCFEQRLERTVRIQCEDFARAYHEALGGMVEDRMVKTIKAVGSVWYSAWVDAGQPLLTDIDASEIMVKVDSMKLLEYVPNGHH